VPNPATKRPTCFEMIVAGVYISTMSASLIQERTGSDVGSEEAN
jgi:hypothetical protein